MILYRSRPVVDNFGSTEPTTHRCCCVEFGEESCDCRGCAGYLVGAVTDDVCCDVLLGLNLDGGVGEEGGEQ